MHIGTVTPSCCCSDVALEVTWSDKPLRGMGTAIQSPFPAQLHTPRVLLPIGMGCQPRRLSIRDGGFPALMSPSGRPRLQKKKKKKKKKKYKKNTKNQKKNKKN
eukprot:NODE_28612_length_472_cov_0.588406.p1 GENE.NODE_28612_length_472_cov_0.588406~~NODE_28612_length_472_cov_0.588406.p1  ORF type:complete len:104 (+),score=34.16 NODE_28612_length_472_cov_0.588406:42-353(+)